MGRYYSGDIEGKFWFGVQSSDDASFFGGEEEEPSVINYHFSTDDLDKINEGLEKCLAKLGKNLTKLDKFFAENDGYNDDMLVKAGFQASKIQTLLEWYARYKLGMKIKKCLEVQSDCYFEAEL